VSLAETENFGRCPRCRQFIVAEQRKTHKCDFEDMPFEKCEEIVLDELIDSGQEKNGDHVYLGWGLDTVAYRLLVCKHNPPHGISKRPRDKLPVYL
jgi:hypothetical protein